MFPFLQFHVNGILHKSKHSKVVTTIIVEFVRNVSLSRCDMVFTGHGGQGYKTNKTKPHQMV